MVLLPAHVLSAGVRPSSPLAVPLPPRATTSVVDALVAPRRSLPPGSRAAAWPQRQGSVGVHVDIHTLVGTSVVVACRRVCRWSWCAAVRLIGSRTALTPVAIPLTVPLLHGDVLCRSSVVGLGIHAQLLVKKGQLLVELAPHLRELVEPRPSPGVGGAVARSRLRFGAARCRGPADIAFSRGVMLSRGLCPLSRHRPRGGAGCAEVVDVARHRVVREAGLSTGVHRGVPLHELPQASGSSPLAWKARSVR
jgi:hypothetical protein